MKKLFTTIATIASCLAAPFVTQAQSTQNSDNPLLTIGCMSDLHNELSLISGSVDNVRLRGTVVNTLKAMKEQEQIDMLILGGDYTSDCTIAEANWARVRDLIQDATKGAFPDGTDYFPVLYCTGNHDYEAANFDKLPKPYNAARYYETVMKNDIGELSADDCFYEDAANSTLGTMPVLAAYHYMIHGFDFVVLNCGKNYFGSAWNYIYSDESVQWVADKLEEIYAKDPEKTVFFIAHVPFPDSRSISNSNKGQKNPDLLKQTLAKYPNLVYIYGHDHGSDNAYIRTKTSQRVTRYDTEGNIIDSFDDTHVDGLTKGTTDNGGSTDNAEVSEGRFYVINRADGRYLGYDGHNSATIATKNLSTITLQDAETGAFVFEIGVNQSGQKHLHIGSGGRFSLGDPTDTYIYKVVSTEGGTITAEKVKAFDMESDYLLVGNRSGSYYALTNKLYNAGSTDQRMESVSVTVTGNTLTVADDESIHWGFGKEESGSQEPEADPSFFTAFMGSMRYYSNSIEGDVSVSNSRVVQGMMIYVYSDRIVFQIKNYGDTGNLNGINIAKEPEAYTVFRTVKPDESSAISTIVTDVQRQEDDAIYDLFGRRVTNPGKGVYIVNGKKVIF